MTRPAISNHVPNTPAPNTSSPLTTPPPPLSLLPHVPRLTHLSLTPSPPSPSPPHVLPLLLPPQKVLILSDEHPNVVRCFALEEDREFVYLALERCR